MEIITTVLRAPLTTDLTDLATTKDELGIPTIDSGNDSWLDRAISQCSINIANYCNRTFPSQGLQDQVFLEQDAYPYQVPGGVFPLQLSSWPILTATGVLAFTGNTHSSTLVDGLSGGAAGLLVGAPISGPGIPAGTTIAAVGAGAANLTLSQPATATASGVALTTGLVVSQQTSPGNPTILVSGTDYLVDAARGWLINLNPWTGLAQKWPTFPLIVQYSAGFTSIPLDLVDACLRYVTMRFKAKGRDPMLTSEGQPGLGQTNYWVGAQPGAERGIPPEIAGLLDNYRVPVVT